MDDKHYYMKPGDVLVVHQDASARAGAENLQVLNDNQFKLIKDLRTALSRKDLAESAYLNTIHKLEGQIKDLKEGNDRQARVIKYYASGASVFVLRNGRLSYHAARASASSAAEFADQLNEDDF